MARPSLTGGRVASLSGICSSATKVAPYRIAAFFPCSRTIPEQIPDKLATQLFVRDGRATPNYYLFWNISFVTYAKTCNLCSKEYCIHYIMYSSSQPPKWPYLMLSTAAFTPSLRTGKLAGHTLPAGHGSWELIGSVHSPKITAKRHKNFILSCKLHVARVASDVYTPTFCCASDTPLKLADPVWVCAICCNAHALLPYHLHVDFCTSWHAHKIDVKNNEHLNLDVFQQ